MYDGNAPTLNPDPPFVDENGNISFSAGDFKVEEISLGKLVDDDIDGVEFKEVVDLSDMWATFTLNQSMTSPFMSLNITISEHKRMFERMGTKGMQGEEFVFIKFFAPTREPIEEIFYVSSIDSVDSTTHNLGYTMVLRCVSKEKLINDVITINKAYEKTISDVVKNIFRSDILRHPEYIALGSGQYSKDGITRKWKAPRLFCDETYGVQKFIVPGLSPFIAMAWLNKRAYGGPSYSGSVYRFFQNTTGYHFANLEKRIQNGVKQDGAISDPNSHNSVPTFTIDPQIQELPKMSVKHYRNITSISSLSTPDTLRRISDGTFSSSVRTIDIVRKSHYDTSYELEKEYPKFKRTGKELNQSSSFLKKFGGAPREHLIFKDTLRENEDFEAVMGKKLAYSKLISSFGYNVTVYGDSNLNIGDVIKLELREAGTTETKDLSMYGGYFLVVNLQHIVDRAKFNTVMTIVKDSPDTLHSKEIT